MNHANTSSPQASAPAAPRKWKMTLLLWAAVYPTITLLLALLGPLVHDLPLALQTLILSLIMVPVVSQGLMPRLTAALRPWLMR